MNVFFKEIDSPVGTLTLIAHPNALLAVLWEGTNSHFPHMVKDENHLILVKAEKQLVEYFQRRRTSFDIPLELIGSDFQISIWNALLTIKYGKTLSYGEVAQKIAKPKAARAAGSAIGRNPLSIFIPCHRVIGSNGSLTGFAGGLKIKKILLDLESRGSCNTSAL